MPNKLKVFDPIRIPYLRRDKVKRINNEHVIEFWENAPRVLARKQGCYVFALKAAKGYKPWYVGMTTKSFASECFALHKRNLYNEVLFRGRKGTPVLFFIALPGSKKKIPKRDIEDIETLFIQYAKTKNPQVKNSKKTKQPEWSIQGVIRGGKGKTSSTSAAFTRMLGI